MSGQKQTTSGDATARSTSQVTAKKVRESSTVVGLQGGRFVKRVGGLISIAMQVWGGEKLPIEPRSKMKAL